MGYEPYKVDAFKELMKFGYGMGWYPGRRQLFSLTMEGQFEGHGEGFSHSHESWAHRFILRTAEMVIDNGKTTLPALTIYGATVEEVCRKALSRLNGVEDPLTNDIPF